MRLILANVLLCLVLGLAACTSTPAPPAPAAEPAAAEPDFDIAPDQVRLETVYVSATGERLSARFDNVADAVTVTLPSGRTVTLPRAVSGSGARYSDGTDTFWEHHGEGTFTTGETTVFQGKAEEDD
ncbi:MAG: lysozyme inhibitor [Acidobacteria bacterium]|nr:lysozyme inhibitor [Acidobacteriota bacterium]